jgi:hypothetical protein
MRPSLVTIITRFGSSMKLMSAHDAAVVGARGASAADEATAGGGDADGAGAGRE